MAIPKITEVKTWSSVDVRNLCSMNRWYTAGDVQAYSKMLAIVDTTAPSNDAIYTVAKDILDHSTDTDLYVEAIMFSLGNTVVKRRYILG